MKRSIRIIAACLLAIVLLGGCAIVPEAKTVAETDLYSVVTYEDGSCGIRVSNKIYIQTLIERATPEWFQNFGLKPFAEEEKP